MEQFAEKLPSSVEVPVETPVIESIPEPVAHEDQSAQNQQADTELVSVSASPEAALVPEVVVPPTTAGTDLSDQELSDGITNVRRSLTDPELEQLSQILISKS